MRKRRIGDLEVSAIGLGAMRLSIEGRPDRTQSIRTIHAAFDAGITLIDTADSYCISRAEAGHSERLVASALRSWGGDRAAVVVATKGGKWRPGDGSWVWDARPSQLRQACEASLRALSVDSITLYQLHTPDPSVPLEDSVGTLRDLREEGKIRLVGLSNVNVVQVAASLAVVEVASVQNEFSPIDRSSANVIRFCLARGIAFLAYRPLGGSDDLGQPGLVSETLNRVATTHGVSPQRVALAWELATAPNVIPLPGARRPETIRDSALAGDLELTAADLAALGAEDCHEEGTREALTEP